jgi:hypothetical protein
MRRCSLWANQAPVGDCFNWTYVLLFDPKPNSHGLNYGSVKALR